MNRYFKLFLNVIIFLSCFVVTYGQNESITQPVLTERTNVQIADSVKVSKGFPVVGLTKDTLFFIYEKLGSFKPQERAALISGKIHTIADFEFLKADSVINVPTSNSIDIVYGETIIMSVTEMDALRNHLSLDSLATEYTRIIKQELENAGKERSFSRLIKRIGLVLLVLLITWGLMFLISFINRKILSFIHKKKKVWFRDFSYRDYTFLSAKQELSIVLFIVKVMKWIVIAVVLYIALPIIFSIFPFTRGWADVLINLIWSPLKGVFISVWDYLPNLFSILVIIIVMRFFIRFVKYIFSEINSQRLKIPGFHADWAMPTFSIVRFLLLAFMLVLIFPNLPGSDSDIFKGVSVFLGILFSLGSSSAIANMVAGLVITYMRPYKIGDRIKIGGVNGDVIEKTLLVTRLKTIKNEIITIPNSSILSGNTINYSTAAEEEGLVVNTTVTIGYDVPWRKMHEALIEAANRTDLLLKEPKPFVFQTSLDDFYVSYQINAYTKEASKQAATYSLLHQHIQDVCNEQGIEIMSPHYRSERDGNKTTIPEEYISKGRKSTGFDKKGEE